MAERRGKLETVRLKTPVTTDAIKRLELGQVVYLDGVLYTAREGVYRRILDEGVAPPLDLKALTNVNFMAISARRGACEQSVQKDFLAERLP